MYQLKKYNMKVNYTFINSIQEIMNSDNKRTKRSNTTADKSSSTGSKKIFDPELQSFTKRTLRFESFSTKDSLKHEKLSIDRIVQKILFALDHFYEEDLTGFYNNCKDFLTKSWDSWKMKIIDRMNTYEYLEMAIRHKSYSQIQSQIVKEWKKNYLLFGIMTFWYNTIQSSKQKFKTLIEFQTQYNIFREFISQITYLIFKGCFTNLQKKKISVLDKLFDQTSHFIITESSEFKKVYEKVLQPLLQCEKRLQKINWQIDLDTLNLKKCIFYQKRSDNMTKTIQALKRFSKEVKLTRKIQSLRLFRQTLQKQLFQNQQRLVKQHQAKGLQILQKDDFISAIIYCIINGQIQDIQTSIYYLKTLLGENMDLLSKMQVNSYAIDIVASIDYLTDESHESQLIIHTNHVFDKRLRIESTPLIEECGFEETLVLTNHMTAKHITSFDENLL